MTPLEHLHAIRKAAAAEHAKGTNTQIPENVRLARQVQGLKQQGVELRPDIDFETAQVIRQDEMTGDEHVKIQTAFYDPDLNKWVHLPNVPHAKRTEFKYRANYHGRRTATEARASMGRLSSVADFIIDKKTYDAYMAKVFEQTIKPANATDVTQKPLQLHDSTPTIKTPQVFEAVPVSEAEFRNTFRRSTRHQPCLSDPYVYHLLPTRPPEEPEKPFKWWKD